MSALADLEALYRELSGDPGFQAEIDDDLAHYVGRPSPLYEARRWSDEIGGARVLLKREDLQPVFSFKLRGAHNRIAHLTEEEIREVMANGTSHRLKKQYRTAD